MTLETWFALAIMNLAYSAPPGPNSAILLAMSSRSGIRGGLAAFGGILLAEVLWAGLAILIVSGVLDMDLLMPGLLEMLGPVMLILLGIPMLVRSAPMPAPMTSAPLRTDVSRTRDAGAAFFIGITNPLAMVFFVSVAPMFLTAGVVTPLAALAFVSAAVASCAIAHAPYLGLARIAGSRLTAMIERGCGGVLIYMGASRFVVLFS